VSWPDQRDFSARPEMLPGSPLFAHHRFKPCGARNLPRRLRKIIRRAGLSAAFCVFCDVRPLNASCVVTIRGVPKIKIVIEKFTWVLRVPRNLGERCPVRLVAMHSIFVMLGFPRTRSCFD